MVNQEEKTRCVYVTFDGIKKYLYKCPFNEVEQGDEVEILISGYYRDEVKVLPVLEVVYFTDKDSPFPLKYMKTVLNVRKGFIGPVDLNSEETLKKIDSIEDLDKEINEYCSKICGYNFRKNWHMGCCHLWWSAKKEILKNKYNIDWLTPVECNPNIIFD